jgi:hypothetical protein
MSPGSKGTEASRSVKRFWEVSAKKVRGAARGIREAARHGAPWTRRRCQRQANALANSLATDDRGNAKRAGGHRPGDDVLSVARHPIGH